MSIKNPYSKEPYDTSEFYAFNEGVKAANEDWMTWAKQIIYGCYAGTCKFRPTCSDLTFNCRAIEEREE